MNKQMIIQLDIYECCNCKKELDLIKTTVSIFLCCEKEFATCMECARTTCPKCNKQRIKRVNRILLNALKVKERKELESMGKVRGDMDEIYGESRFKNEKEIMVESFTKDAKHLKNDNNQANHKINTYTNKKSHKEEQANKKHCIICEIPISTTTEQRYHHHYQSINNNNNNNKNRSEEEEQLAICKICEEQNSHMLEQYNQNHNQCVLEHQQKQECLLLKENNNNNKKNEDDSNKKYIEREQCVVCEKELSEGELIHYYEEEVIRLCQECKELNERSEREFVICNNKNKNKYSIDDDSKKEQHEKQQKQYNRQKQHYQQQKQQNNHQESDHDKQIKNEQTQITMTTIQKSRKQDLLDMKRKYSIEEAEEEKLEIVEEVELYCSLNDHNNSNNLNNKLHKKPSLKQCQKCSYYLLEENGLLIVTSDHPYNQERKDNQNIEEHEQQYKFLCILCANHVILSTKNNMSSTNNKDREIFIR